MLSKFLRERTYLGDGLYVSCDGAHIVLAANNGIEDTNTVYLEPMVLKAFEEYIVEFREAVKEAGGEF